MNGILNIYKEKGMTSHDVVAKVRRILQMRKVGHTGTLDPEATGVLPICLGKATKIAEFLTTQNKSYRCEMTLGITTTTEDHTGQIIEQKPVDFDIERIQDAIISFQREYDQIPPMYSALKVNGKKLYELARQGIEVERKPRRVTIFSIKILEMIPPNKVRFDVTCSKGTYIRTLCVDIGNKLGCGAHMSELIRTNSGIFNIDQSISLEELDKINQSGDIKSVLIPIDAIFCNSPKLIIKSSAQKALLNGNEIFIKGIQAGLENIQDHDQFRVYDHEKQFIGIYQLICTDSEQKIKPIKLFI